MVVNSTIDAGPVKSQIPHINSHKPTFPAPNKFLHSLVTSRFSGFPGLWRCSHDPLCWFCLVAHLLIGCLFWPYHYCLVLSVIWRAYFPLRSFLSRFVWHAHTPTCFFSARLFMIC
jgi:hypothetical protein